MWRIRVFLCLWMERCSWECVPAIHLQRRTAPQYLLSGVIPEGEAKTPHLQASMVLQHTRERVTPEGELLERKYPRKIALEV